jgi:hypothetical protein
MTWPLRVRRVRVVVEVGGGGGDDVALSLLRARGRMPIVQKVVSKMN